MKARAIPLGYIWIMPLSSRTLRTVWTVRLLCVCISWNTVGCSAARWSASVTRNNSPYARVVSVTNLVFSDFDTFRKHKTS